MADPAGDECARWRGTRVTDTDEQTSGLLAAADHLERWAESLPRWSEASQEPWYAFVDRRYEAEVALIQRLQRVPRCRLKVCPTRQYVDLVLGGISVSTHQGLAAALREWARRVRAQVR